MEAYLDFLAGEKKENTVASYRRDLTVLSLYFHSKPLVELTEQDLRLYFSHLGKKASAVSLTRAVSVVRSYYRFKLGEEGPMASIRATDFRVREASLLSLEELNLLSSPLPGGIRNRRDEAMLSLLLETGIRVSELVGINRDDVFTEENAVWCGTGEEKRKLFLSYATAERLRGVRVLSAITNPEETALFLGPTGKRMTRQGFWKNLKNRGVQLGIEDLSPARLRQSLAKAMLSRGQTRSEVKASLGTQSDVNLRKYEKQLKEMKKWD